LCLSVFIRAKKKRKSGKKQIRLEQWKLAMS
jgi:hypothetical protein